MKLSLLRENLFAGLQIVSRAVSTRSTLPSLGGIQLDAAGSSLTLRATDMELGLTMVLQEVQVESEGTVLLPGRLLGDVVRSLPPGEVTLALRPEQRDVELTASAARFHLRTLPAEDFPRLPELAEDAATLPSGPLAETIDRVARAASRDEVRPILTGVLFQADGLEAHHGRDRLLPPERQAHGARGSAQRRHRGERPGARTAGACPDRRPGRRRGGRLCRWLATRPCSGRGNVVLSSRLIEGQFPSWRQLIPESFEHEVRLPRTELLEVARRISQLAQRNAPLRFAFAEGELTVAAETPEVGDAREAIPAPYSGEPLEIAFNPQFVIEGIESVDGEELVMKLSSPLRPGLLEPIDSEDFSYLVMPIRLNV